MITIFDESVFSLNKFKRPKVLENREGIYTLLIRLFLLEPGTIQSHPEMGIGIVSKYRYSFEGRARELQQKVEDQISKYLPELQGVYVKITDTEGKLDIAITIDNVLYDFSFDTDQGRFLTLSELRQQ